MPTDNRCWRRPFLAAGALFCILSFLNDAVTVVPEAERQRDISRYVLGTLMVLSFYCATPWFRWRFSLRSLLIATTMAAVWLSAVVWLTK